MMSQKDILANQIEGALEALDNHFYTPEELKETSQRIARVWLEMTESTNQSPPSLKWFKTESVGFLIKGPVEFYSLCPHHLLPMIFKVLVGFVPNGYTIGVSKITRTTIWACKRLALQEDITKIIADTLWNVQEHYKPYGLIVGVIGDHFCEKVRGVTHPSPTITVEIRGSLNEDMITLFQKHLDKMKK